MEGTKIPNFLTDIKPARITRNTLFQNSLHTGLNIWCNEYKVDKKGDDYSFPFHGIMVLRI